MSWGQVELQERQGKEAGVGLRLKQNLGGAWLKSAEVMQTLRRDTFLHEAEKQTVWGDLKALPLCQDLPGPNHLAALVSRGKVFHSYDHGY